MARQALRIPAGSLVVLVGPSGAGKSTFARTRFRTTEIVSSDVCRALVSDDAADRTASEDAFDLLRFIVGKRLRAGRLTVVDATNVREADRTPLLTLARACGARTVAVVLDLPQDVCLERNARRATERVPPRAIREQVADLHEGLGRLRAEGFQDVHVLTSPEEADAVAVERI